MIIDSNKIEHAIFNGSAKEAAELCGISAQTIRQYRSAKDSNAYRDWKKISIAKAEEIMQSLENK